MTRKVLDGLNGANPLGFLASIGLLRLLDRSHGASARLGFLEDGSFRAWIEGHGETDLAALVAADAAAAAGPQPWRLEYEKSEKNGVKVVADLKAPPGTFSRFIDEALKAWSGGSDEGANYAAAFATDVAVDNKGNTKPTAFHFTAGQQQFLGSLEKIRASVSADWARESLEKPGAVRPGENLRWDPDSERSRALLAFDPSGASTAVNAPLEWLAFRALPALPTMPFGSRVLTTAVTGRRQDEITMHWPLWSVPASYAAARSVLAAGVERLSPEKRAALGVFATCSSEIRRVGQGYGSFAPARVNP